jgi:hypothetical protein
VTHSEKNIDASVIVIAICSLPQLERAITAIETQEFDGTAEIIVAADPRLGDLAPLQSMFPRCAFLSRADCKTPIELTVMALNAASGDRIVLTEDSCIASEGWLRAITGVPPDGHGAVGGVVEAMPDISNAMWAFCYVDFFKYMRPVAAGPAPTLSVCNVAYSRSDLFEVADAWSNGFVETEMHGLLEKKFGPLWLSPDAEVRVMRDVTPSDAVYERYAFGRLFGAARIAESPMKRRAFYVLTSPALPALLVSRMLAKARSDSALMKRFVGALPELLTMVFAWSWGETLGYITGRRPRRVTTAPERVLRLKN